MTVLGIDLKCTGHQLSPGACLEVAHLAINLLQFNPHL